MATMIDKIRAEIKRRIELCDSPQRENSWRAAEELKELLSFLDTLPEEKQEDLEEEITAYINTHYHIRNDETLEKGNDPLTTFDFEEIARHFYNLGHSSKQEIPSEDLVEAALLHLKDVMGRKIITGLDTGNMTSFKAGAQWQKQQQEDTEEVILLKDQIESLQAALRAKDITHCPKIKGWVVRERPDVVPNLLLFKEKPVRKGNVFGDMFWYPSDRWEESLCLPSNFFPEVKWEDEEPVEVELIIKKL